LAAIAFQALADVQRLAAEGYIVLLYPEGTRSRTGELQPFLRAAARYLAMDGARVLPTAQVGCDRMFPIGSAVMFPTPVTLSFGPAFTAADYPGKTGALEEVWRRVGGLLRG
jgi:1-acyl-sn-glycerol-3-phosphate acyltransferase